MKALYHWRLKCWMKNAKYSANCVSALNLRQGFETVAKYVEYYATQELAAVCS